MIETQKSFKRFSKRVNLLGCQQTLLAAAEYGNLELIKLMLDAGLKANSQNKNILHAMFGAKHQADYDRMTEFSLKDFFAYLDPQWLYAALISQDQTGKTPLDLLSDSTHDYFHEISLFASLSTFVTKTELEISLTYHGDENDLKSKSTKISDVF